tara:strand:+ start:14798 stop:15964 length:1167 start_codon:yes stop_codon:yes gene_type:complete
MQQPRQLYGLGSLEKQEFVTGAPDIKLKGDLRMASADDDYDFMEEDTEENTMELMKDQGIPYGEQVSAPSRSSELNDLSMSVFGKSLNELTEIEIEMLMNLAREKAAYGGIMNSTTGRRAYGLGSIFKSVGKAVKGVAKGVKKFAKSDLGKAAILAGVGFGIPGTSFGGLFGRASFGGAAKGLFGHSGIGPTFSALKGSMFPGATEATDAVLSKKAKGTLASFAIGSLGSAALSAAEAGGLDTSDPNAQVDLESLQSYLSTGYKNLNPNATDEEVNLFVQENTSEYRAMGGRIGYAMGSDELVEQASGIEGLPININSRGIKELDLRKTGGFVPPVGVKEKADDIPAMLSNNEFVFTADAVRAAGGGSVDKGAQIMYDTMKRLEGRLA